MMKWEAEQKGYTCNDCYLSMQNCHNKSICCEDETGLCDLFEELSDLKENKMNNDSISRQAAIDAIESIGSLDTEADREYARSVFEELPSAQPEIIRCKDCKHYYFADNRIPQEQRYVCALDGDRWKPEDFCSFAERRTDE